MLLPSDCGETVLSLKRWSAASLPCGQRREASEQQLPGMSAIPLPPTQQCPGSTTAKPDRLSAETRVLAITCRVWDGGRKNAGASTTFTDSS